MHTEAQTGICFLYSHVMECFTCLLSACQAAVKDAAVVEKKWVGNPKTEIQYIFSWDQILPHSAELTSK